MNQVITLKKITQRYQRIIIPVLYLIMFLSLAVPTYSYYSGFIAYLSVGSVPAEFTVGQDGALFTVGELTPAPIEPYVGVKPIILIIPGLLLLAFIVFCGYIGISYFNKNQVVEGMISFIVGFILIGITLMIGVPMIINGIESTIWFK